MGDYYKDKRDTYDYGEYLHKKLYICGKSQRQLAKDLNYGSVTSVQRLVRGAIKMTLPLAIDICKATGISFYDWAKHSKNIDELRLVYEARIAQGDEPIKGIY